jgi:YD repeat-containing protein
MSFGFMTFRIVVALALAGAQPAFGISPTIHSEMTDDDRTEYVYDPLDQLTAVTFTGNDETTQALAFAYDPLGQLLTEQSAAGNLNHHYDELAT